MGGNPSIVSNRWYKLKIEVSEGKQVKFYLNGVLLGTVNAYYRSVTCRGWDRGGPPSSLPKYLEDQLHFNKPTIKGLRELILILTVPWDLRV